MKNSPPERLPTWRQSTLADVDAICRIETAVHPLMQERAQVHAEKMQLFPAGCRVLVDGTETLGYAASYPWRFGEVPMLDTFFTALPEDADCLFIHDVAVLPAARGRGSARAFVDLVARLARDRALARLALVSVYGTVPVWNKLGFDVATAIALAKLAPYGDTARYSHRELT